MAPTRARRPEPPPPRCAQWAEDYAGARSCSHSSTTSIAITHPDRVIWPQLGVTKLELARYVGEVGEWMLRQFDGGALFSVAPFRLAS